MADTDDKPALVLVDHGSDVEEANLLLDRIVKELRARGDHGMVRVAHMELAPPSLSDAFSACAQRGAASIVIVPYFLAPGRHVSEDIPRMAREAAERCPGVRWAVAEPLGFDE